MRKLFFSCVAMLSLVVCSIGFSACSSDEETVTEEEKVLGYMAGADFTVSDDYKMEYTEYEDDEYSTWDFCEGIKRRINQIRSKADTVQVDERSAQEKYNLLLNETQTYFDSLKTVDPKKYNAEIEIHFMVYIAKYTKSSSDFVTKKTFDFLYNGAAYHKQ